MSCDVCVCMCMSVCLWIIYGNLLMGPFACLTLYTEESNKKTINLLAIHSALVLRKEYDNKIKMRLYSAMT